MPTTEPAILRALEGLASRSGRTVVVLGPPGSEAPALLNYLGTGVESAGGRAVRLRGTYRGRSTPFSALDGIDRSEEEPPDVDREDVAPLGVPEAAFVPLPPLPTEPASGYSSRRRGGGVRTTFLGEVVRTPGRTSWDPDEFWADLLKEFRGPDARPVGILLEDAEFADVESREFLVSLSARARLRPLLIAVAVDSTSSAATVWEEALVGRANVEWIRLNRGTADPREVHRLRDLLMGLTAPTARLVGYVTLLGGETTDLIASRVARLSISQLTEGLQPAVAAGLVRIKDGKVTLAAPSLAPALEELFPEEERRAWHLQIADGLQALSAEPPLSRRIEIAQHSFASARDAVAMARLFEAAEFSLDLLEFDGAGRLLAQVIACLAEMAPAATASIAPEVHLLNARARFSMGLPVEAEAELREGVESALRAQVPPADLASWIEPLLPALEATGPRGTLGTLIGELGDRLHDAGYFEAEVLLETLLPVYAAARNLLDRARSEALRAAHNARRLKERPLQALGLFTMGVSRIRGTPEEMVQAERFLAAARQLLRETRRSELDHIAGEFMCRLLEARGAVDEALVTRKQSVALLERARLPTVGLFHQLGIAEIHLNRGDLAAADAPLDSARKAVDSLRLLPPAPGLLQTWLLEGRRYALTDSIGAARDRWSALIDLPAGLSLPRVRAEALLRLALLERSVGNHDASERLARQLDSREVTGALPTVLRDWAAAVHDTAATAKHGGGPLPGALPPGSSQRKRGERRRV